VGLAAGYALGYRHLGQAAPPSRATPASIVLPAVADSAAPPGLAASAGGPGAYSSSLSITLGQVSSILPLGGLRPISQQWAPCGAISSSWQSTEGGSFVFIKASTGEVETGSSTVLPPYGTAWLSVTFRVLVACPGPLPVQFSVSYRENGRTGTAQLPGFPDLGRVTYTGCKGSS
jgi:hypothetical protein